MLNPPEEPLRACLESLVPEVSLTYGEDPPEPASYELLIAGRPSERLLDASPQLKVLLIPYAGVPARTRELMLARPHLRMHNIHHNAGPAAELAMALLLSAAKFIVPMDRSLRTGDWSPRYEPNPSVLLHGKQALVLGYGAIGRRIAGACLGLGMRVTALRRRCDGTSAGDSADNPAVDDTAANLRVVGPQRLMEELPRTDALLAALPLTDRTRGLIGAAEFARLPPHAVVVNVGRGPVLDQTALYHALRDGRIRAAGLDVWYNYPAAEAERTCTAPADHPFADLPNVVMSPHRGGALGLEESERFRVTAIAATLRCAAAGEPLPHPVDVTEGY